MASSAWKLYWKFGWGLDSDNKKSPIPYIIQKDGHMNWDRSQPWFKDECDHIGFGQYSFK